MLWAIKQRIIINLPYQICQHMMKCKKTTNMPLPYGVLITRIMECHGVDLSREYEIQIGYSSLLDEMRLNKLKIIKVDGVWQYTYGAPNQRHHQDQQHQCTQSQQVLHTHDPHFVPHDHPPSDESQHGESSMLQQIYSGIQGLQNGINNLSITMSDGFQRTDNRFADFIHTIDNRFQSADNRFDEFVQRVDNRFETFDKKFEDLQRYCQGPS